jgi:hypothetical protein
LRPAVALQGDEDASVLITKQMQKGIVGHGEAKLVAR